MSGNVALGFDAIPGMQIFLIVSAAMGFLCGTTALDNGLARTPPMGWRSWNAYGSHINQDLMDNAADMLVDTSRGFSLKGGSTLLTSQHRFSDSIYRLPDRGYSRVGLDDYYQLCGAGASGSFHNASGYPVIDLSLFPDMKSAPCSLAIHPRNLCPHRVCVFG